jgi:hypothetical protein
MIGDDTIPNVAPGRAARDPSASVVGGRVLDISLLGTELVWRLKALLPRQLLRAGKRLQRRRVLRSTIRRLSALSPGQVPSRYDLERLRFGWGNVGWSADVEYLRRMAEEAARTEGPILECGSGLTTLILGLVAGPRGVDVWTMEHHAEWFGRLKGTLDGHGIANQLRHAPLQSYGDFSWYTPPLHEMPERFRLVVCDGPPGRTPGGRYGLLPVMRERLAPGSMVILDDAARPEEIAVLERWREETGATYSFFGEGDSSALVTIPTP